MLYKSLLRQIFDIQYSAIITLSASEKLAYFRMKFEMIYNELISYYLYGS